jgi:predicted phage terminase large subunit-like protein
LLAAVRKERTRREAARLKASLAAFFRASWHVLEPSTPFADNWHVDAISDHLQAVFEAWLARKQDPTYRPDLQNVLFNVPPGTSKSRIVSVCFNAWAWLHDPTFSLICLSANPNVALRDADMTRSLIESKWYRDTFVIDWIVRPDKNAVGSFQIARYPLNKNGTFREQLLGKRQSKGLTAKITGERADCILVDDPHDATDVFSDAKRTEVLNKWDNSIYNRVNDLSTSIRIGIMQRLHQDDWSAHVLKHKQQKWMHVVIPLEYDKNVAQERGPSPIGWADPRTTDGENLHATRFPVEFIGAEKERLGSFGFKAQYDQCPIDANGGILKAEWFRWFRFDSVVTDSGGRPFGCNTAPARVLSPLRRGNFFDQVHLTVDSNFKETKSGSECAILVIGQLGPDFFVIDDLTAPRGFTETVAVIRRLVAQYNPNSILIEDKANGSAIIDTLTGEFSMVLPIEPDGGKEARAHAVSPVVESGHVFILEGAPWAMTFMAGPDSVPAFPLGRRDDRLDALTQALNHLRGPQNLLGRYAALSTM